MAEPRATVLVVEDEESFVEALVVGLKREGFLVKVARDGAEALGVFDAVRPDLVLLDVMLPKVNGIDVCRELRAKSRVPIIMVTAKSEEIDTVVGLEVGADDYVTKPYRLRELVARMRAVLRRSPLAAEAEEPGDPVVVGDLRLDPERHEVSLRGEIVNLPLKEFELLELLLTNAGRVLTRETLIDRVWGPNYVGDTKTLDVHVKRLRSKIEDDPAAPRRITTIRGLGYKFESVPAAARPRTPDLAVPAVDQFAAAVADCERQGWAAVAQAVGAGELAALAGAVADLVLEPLKGEVGPVRQAGAAAVCAVAGRPALAGLAERLSRAADAAGAAWHPDEAVTTLYGPGEGISAHRDNTFYEGFVAVVTLAGRAELAVVADREGREELARWEAGPGDLALFRGPRPGGEARPLHEVGPAGPGGRRVLVLRRNARGAGRGWKDG